VHPLVLAGELARSDLVLDLVERADLAQRFARECRLGILRFEEAAPRMRPALGVRDARLALSPGSSSPR